MPARAKGRLLSSGLSRSRQFAALSIHGKVLYPLLVANSDDQGRLPADPDRVKWSVCPNVEEVRADHILVLLAEIQRAGLAIIYDDGAEPVIQLTQWWDDQSSMQWAYPSEFAPPKGWDDRLRFRTKNQVVTINWPGSADRMGDSPLGQLTESLGGPPSLRVALGKATATPPPLLEHEHEHEHEQEVEGNLPKALPKQLSSSPLLSFLYGLENWGEPTRDDPHWLEEFVGEFPGFDLGMARATRDYHSGKQPPRQKGVWKTRFRRWMQNERPIERDRPEGVRSFEDDARKYDRWIQHRQRRGGK